jgi:thioredoxin 1
MSENSKLSRFFLIKSLKQQQNSGLNSTPKSSNPVKNTKSIGSIHTPSVPKVNFNIQDEDEFKKRVIENEKIVIVDFHASWCGPCKILGPKLEKIVGNFNGKAVFAKVDIDQLTDLALDYKVNSVPTVVAIKNGKEVGKFVGIMDDDRLKKFVKDAIDK